MHELIIKLCAVEHGQVFSLELMTFSPKKTLQHTSRKILFYLNYCTSLYNLDKHGVLIVTCKKTSISEHASSSMFHKKQCLNRWFYVCMFHIYCMLVKITQKNSVLAVAHCISRKYLKKTKPSYLEKTKPSY